MLNIKAVTPPRYQAWHLRHHVFPKFGLKTTPGGFQLPLPITRYVDIGSSDVLVGLVAISPMLTG